MKQFGGGIRRAVRIRFRETLGTASGAPLSAWGQNSGPQHSSLGIAGQDFLLGRPPRPTKEEILISHHLKGFILVAMARNGQPQVKT